MGASRSQPSAENTGAEPSAAGFTPGPWEVSILTPTLVVSRVDDDLVRNLAHVTIADGQPLRSPEGERAKANARLIAAAPALLEACQQFVRYDSDPDQSDVQMMLDYGSAITRARAAIAKALLPSAQDTEAQS